MSAATGVLRRQVEPSRTTLALAAGDVLVVVLVLVAGEIRHGVDPVGQFAVVADTLAPFLLGWLLASVAAGIYRPDVRADVGRAATRTAAAWVVAALVGAGLRSTDYFHGSAPLAFVAVVTLVPLALLVAWRVAVAYAGVGRPPARVGG